jgi:hypothetical protein
MDTPPTKPVVNLGALSAAVPERYRNWVVDEVNASCLRLAVMTGEYPWHRHETSDELFVSTSWTARGYPASVRRGITRRHSRHVCGKPCSSTAVRAPAPAVA